ncbi:ER membrane protein complex subunit 8-like isoform X2 [Halichondria panicea]|uniref:ER membrane protein complex subunit 8-like isoform X2 n=1 Tax=Halichondria panicea TaxID=6063 RepID=UPI00312B41CB
MSYTISLKAYSKIILHCSKYPHKAINGVVIGSVSKETQSVQIQDAIPMFHLGIGLAPMLEVALTQVEIYCDTKGLSIVGYYHANERVNDATISDTAVTIANKIAVNCDKACLLILQVLKSDSGHSHWKEHLSALKFLDEQTIVNTRKLVQNNMAEILVDFDNHLDDIQLDWTNPKINRALPNGTIQ